MLGIRGIFFTCALKNTGKNGKHDVRINVHIAKMLQIC